MTAAQPGPGFAGRVVRGIGWTVGAQLVVQVTRIPVGIALAHLLTPRDFGLAGMALVFSGLVTAFSDLSLGAALVQRRELTEEDRSTVFWTTLGFGVLCTGFGIAVSGLIGRFYGSHEVTKLFAVLSLSFVVVAGSVAPTSLLQRELRYRTVQVRGTTGLVIGAAAAIVAAVAGLGAWAIILQTVVGVVVSSALVWLASDWRPRFVYSVESLRAVGGFGLKLFASRMLAYLNLNADNLLVGRFLGAHSLGVYSLAYNVMFTPMLRIGLPVQQALIPAFSRLQAEPERLVAAWLRSKRMSAALLAPAFLGMAVTAPDFVPVVFGDKWRHAVPVLQLLCISGVAHSLVTLNWTALQAVGRAGTVLRLNIFVTVVTLGAFAAGLRWGIVGVAGLFAAAKWLLVLPDTWVTSRALSTRLRDALAAGGTVLPAAAAAAATVWLLRRLLVSADVAAAARVAAMVVVGVLAYLVYARLMTPSVVADFRNLLRRRAAGAAPAA